MRERRLRIDKNTILGLSAILLWSTSIALVRSIAEKAGPFTGGASVYLVGAFLLGCHGFLAKRRVPNVWKLPRLYLLGCGSLFVVYTVALYLALGMATSRTQAIEVGMVNYLWPTFSILFSLVLLSKRGSVGLVPGTLLALVGICLVLTQDGNVSWHSFLANVSSEPAVYALALLAAVSWALYSNLARRWTDASQGGAVPWFMAATGIVLLCVRLLHPEESIVTTRLVLEVVCLGVTTALGYTFWDTAMRKGDIVLVMVFSYLTPFFSTAMGCLYLQIVPGARLWIGCFFVVTGSILSWYSMQ
ncbi:MAG: aromatic amino acid DMT transporter YddG, partial [Lentisphaeria bacterium]|nr:aromatic amino acid DMT transporter YddG [Lentisphaeria bacterium]